ncbi:MAG: hypothetical protein QG608_2765, partial [Actinomycetota bacterium]|nr:hypothetical protein [Actinomycetota bacterium]
MAEGSRPGVVVDVAGIDRRLEVNADALELLFRGTRGGREQPLADAMAAARAAMAYANDAVVPDTVWAESIEPSPEGPVVFWDLTGTPEQNRSWLTAFTDEMVRGGWSGTLDPAPRSPSEWVYYFDATTRPAAYLAFRMNEEPPPGTVGRWGPPRWA